MDWITTLPFPGGAPPLASEVSDLLPAAVGGTFSDEAAAASPIAWWLKPATPLLLVVAYLCSEPLLEMACEKLGTTGKSTVFKLLMALHNLVLVVFSGAVMVHSWPLVLGYGQQHGWKAAYCDADYSMWNDAKFGFWATVFYLSKYYEFIDTWVLIIKRRKPSLLQVYHHAGIAITMWGATVTQGSWVAWVVCLNSTIHTVMYTYFFFSTLGIKIPGAQFLTMAQILQFVTGIAGTAGVQFFGAECQSDASRFVLAAIQIYAVGLILLFSAFFKKKYKAN